MDKQFKDKIIRLGKYMNGNSKFSVPLVRCIQECFEIVMSEHEADLLLMVGSGAYTKEQLRQLWQLEDAEFEETFRQILEKSLLWERREPGTYELVPIFPGWIELYASGPVNESRKKLIAKFAEFEELLKQLNIPPVRAYMNRVNTGNMERENGRMSTVVSRGSKTVEINKPLTSEQTVYTEGEIYPMLEKHKGHISVMGCFCRLKEQLEGHSCDYGLPVEGCMSLGRLADQLVEAGIARRLEYDEAVQMIADFEKKGCIHTIYHYGVSSDEEEMTICNCCVDCCFLYSSYREGALSQLLMKVYFRPQLIDENQCVGCGRCGRYCPTGATGYDRENKKLIFRLDRCIGCGQCVTQCPKPVREMVRDERNVFVKTRRKKEWETHTKHA